MAGALKDETLDSIILMPPDSIIIRARLNPTLTQDEVRKAVGGYALERDITATYYKSDDGYLLHQDGKILWEHLSGYVPCATLRRHVVTLKGPNRILETLQVTNGVERVIKMHRFEWYSAIYRVYIVFTTDGLSFIELEVDAAQLPRKEPDQEMASELCHLDYGRDGKHFTTPADIMAGNLLSWVEHPNPAFF